MISTEQLDLLPQIYGAAIADELWPNVLDLIVRSVNAKGAFLSAHDKVLMPFNLNHASQIYAENTADIPYYVENFAQYDQEAMHFISEKPPQKLILDTDIWGPINILQQRRDYVWTKQKFGLFRRVGARLNGNEAWFDSIFFQFDNALPQIPTTSLSHIGNLLPHLAKSIEMNRFFAILQARFNAALGALNRVKIGVVILQGNGHVLIRNTEAQRIIDMMDGIEVGRNGRLECRREEDTQKMLHHINRIAQTAAGDDKGNEEVMTIARRSNDKPLLIEISPLRDSKGELEAHFTGVMISIIDPSNKRSLSTDNLGELYQLTQAELAVCEALINGLTQANIAERRNVSPETIKTQVQSIYQKTQARGRTDLIRLVVDINPPIEQGS